MVKYYQGFVKCKVNPSLIYIYVDIHNTARVASPKYKILYFRHFDVCVQSMYKVNHNVYYIYISNSNEGLILY